MSRGRCIAILARDPVNGIPAYTSSRLIGRRDFTQAYRSGLLEIWVTPGTPSVALGENGMLVGHIFSGHHPAKVITHFDRHQTGVIEQSGGTSLLSRFWGAFAAFMVNPQKLTLLAIRDPSPGFPIYRRETGKCVVFATHIDDFELLGLERPSVDLPYVAAHLQNPGFRYTRTGLVGIKELPPGERFIIRDRAIECSAIWSPWQFANRGSQIDDRDLASAMLRTTIDGCVSAWCSLYRHAILGVSGGLDSSIVASALQRSDSALTLINYLSMEGSPGDERAFVQALSQGLNHDVVTAREDVARIDFTRSDAAHLPRPVARAFSQSGAHSMITTARARSADVVFSGAGGDNVFCYVQSSAPIIDLIRSGARPRQVLQAAKDVNQITNVGIVPVAKAALRRLRQPYPTWLWKANRAFLTEPWHEEAFEVQSHPWLTLGKTRSAGKLEHVGALVTIFNYLEGFEYERHLPVIHPLLSQPVVELCLRIPTWLWCEAGANRAVARAAYADALPQVTIQRQSKGSCDRLCIELIEQQRSGITEFLCGGILASVGMIRADEIREAISAMASYRDLAWSHILTLVDAEAWVRARS